MKKINHEHGNYLAATIDDLSELFRILEQLKYIDMTKDSNIKKRDEFTKVEKEFNDRFRSDSRDLRQLIDEMEKRKKDNKIAEVANHTMLPENTPEKNRPPSRVFKEFTSFQPEFKVSPNTSRLDYQRWKDTQKIFLKVCNADLLGISEQQALFYQKVKKRNERPRLLLNLWQET